MKKWFVCMQGQQYPRSHGHGQEVERRNQCPVLSTHQTSPVHCPVWCPPAQAHTIDQRALKALGLEQLPWRESCRSRAGSEGVRGTLGHRAALQVTARRPLLLATVCGEGPETTDRNWNEGDSEWNWGKPFPPWGGWSSSTGCPGRLCRLHPWRLSRPEQLGLTMHLPQCQQEVFLGEGFPTTLVLVLCSLVGIQVNFFSSVSLASQFLARSPAPLLLWSQNLLQLWWWEAGCTSAVQAFLNNLHKSFTVHCLFF